MLYDKRWDAKVETKADPFTLESLIAWLETRNPDERYDWTDGATCMCAQYFNVGALWDSQPGVRPDGLAVVHPWTFGAALERARAELAKRPAHAAGQRERA